jgi:caa(3)-type oxidase subunit IV
MAHEQAATIDANAHHGAHPDSYYVKIWALLLVLLVISIAGPLLEHQVITLITAFGIAVIKAGIVCAYFMHLSTEKSYVSYLLLIALLLMGLMFSGVSPDVMKMQGTNWRNTNEITLPPAVHHDGAASHHEEGTAMHHEAQHQDAAATPQHPAPNVHHNEAEATGTAIHTPAPTHH